MVKYLATVFVILFYIGISGLDAEDTGSVTYDSKCLQINGKDVFIYSGAFHYFRVPKELWKDRFQKMKEAGLNCVETYVPWNYHERQAPSSPSDFSKMDLSELESWITMAESYGFYIIIRPGAYICAEWEGGGFPQWLVALKKPAALKNKVWLQTTDPDFLKWNKHFYDAVTRVVAPHQLTHKVVGQAGVILFQIENEYERIKFIPKTVKKNFLESLAVWSRDGGIDVPIFTCWTTESRNVQGGPLKGVFDFMNFYPKWNIKGMMTPYAQGQKIDEPFAPNMCGELQGGWYSEVGGLLSKDIDGVAAVQTQNITFYTLQLGFSLINYYMFVGGTNFDDWASRDVTTTYDFYAPIRENGGVDEKFRRVKGIAEMLKEHGANIARSENVEIKSVVSDTLVEVALRRSVDGERFFFVRTQERKKDHSGNAIVTEPDGTQFSFDFALEPFGSQIFYLPAGTTDTRKGIWYPKLPSPEARPVTFAKLLIFHQIEKHTDELPTKWISLKNNEPVEKKGLLDRHFIYYRFRVEPGKTFVVGRLGNDVVNKTKGDAVLAMVNGTLLKSSAEDKDGVSFVMPVSKNKEVVLLFENRGLHHHTNIDLERNWLIGVRYVKVDGENIPIQFASTEKVKGLAFSSVTRISSKGWKKVEVEKLDTLNEGLLSWYRINFELPDKPAGKWAPWKLNLNASGNGFIYLNGHCIGRNWVVGPQREFFLPECWLNFGKGKNNSIVISLCPCEKGTNISNISVDQDDAFAEYR